MQECKHHYIAGKLINSAHYKMSKIKACADYNHACAYASSQVIHSTSVHIKIWKYSSKLTGLTAEAEFVPVIPD